MTGRPDPRRRLLAAGIGPGPAEAGALIHPGRPTAKSDNLAPGSGRSFDVTPDELEQALRDSLSRRVSVPPPPAAADLAGTAVRRARRIHRRRTIAGAALAALATAAVSAGVVQFGAAPGNYAGPAVVGLGDPPTAARTSSPVPPSVSASPSEPGRRDPGPADPPLVDIVVATDLSTAAGDLVDLSRVGTVVQAQRAPGGWLVVSTPAPDRSSLWYATRTEPPRAVLSGVDAVVLAPDGQRIAWREQGQVHVGSVSAGEVTTSTQTPVSAGAVPVGFVGVAVLLRDHLAAGNNGYDLWWPSGESYQESWNSATVGVYGSLPDRRTVVGQVSVGTPPRPCLALLDASRDLTPVKTACRLPLSAGGHGSISPDGRWLVANGVPDRKAGSGTPTELAFLVDLGTAFGKSPLVRAAGPRLTGPAVWTGAATLVHADERGELVRVAADRVAAGGADDVARFTVPGAAPNDRLIMVAPAAS
jgi:hypothetical protein